MRKNKTKAIELRKSGKSYTQISRLLHIPKSTLSGWFKGLHYSEEIKKRLSSSLRQKAAESIIRWNKLRTERYHIERQKIINEFSERVPIIDQGYLFFLGLALYWAEGGKKEKFTVRFTNSDPDIIKLWMKFLREICRVHPNKIIPTVHIHPNLSDDKAKKYWSSIIGIPINQFRKSQTKISLSSLRKRPYNTLPFGTCRIHVGNSKLRQQLEGWLEGIKKQLTA